MATDYFLKIDGIDGESTDARHPNEIVVTSWSVGVTNAGGLPGGSGGGAGKATLQTFHFTKPYDKASIPLFIAGCSGQRLKSATLVCRRAGDVPFDFLTITLSDVSVTSDTTVGNAEGVLDQVSLLYARILCSYAMQGPNGQALPPVAGGWDLVANRKL